LEIFQPVWLASPHHLRSLNSISNRPHTFDFQQTQLLNRVFKPYHISKVSTKTMEGVAHGIELNPSFSSSQQGDQVVQQTEHVQQQSQSVQQGLDAQAKLSQIDVQQLRAQIQQQFQEQFEAQVQQLQAEM